MNRVMGYADKWSVAPGETCVLVGTYTVTQADVDEGVVDGMATAEQNELVSLRRDKRRLEQEVEILRRATAYFAKDAAPK